MGGARTPFPLIVRAFVQPRVLMIFALLAVYSLPVLGIRVWVCLAIMLRVITPALQDPKEAGLDYR